MQVKYVYVFIILLRIMIRLVTSIHITHLQLRNNIQSMITGYKDTCLEREELLTSLADVRANPIIIYYFHCSLSNSIREIPCSLQI